METIGEKIRAIRLRKGLNQSELAKGIVTASMISQIESDKAKPSHSVLTQIANRLSVSLEDLIGDTTLNFKASSQFNMAKAMIIQGEYTSALRLLDDLTERQQDKIEPFEVAYLHTYCYIQVDRLDEAMNKIESLQHHAELQDSKYQEAKMQYLRGLLEVRRKCYPLAEYLFQISIQALDQSKVCDEWLASSALVELGKVQQEQGKLTASLQTFEQASVVLESRHDLESLGQLFLVMAERYLDSDRPKESAECAQRAVICLEAVSNMQSKLIMEMRIAVVQAATGNTSVAEQKLLQVAEELTQLKKSEDAGVAYAELAHVYLTCQKIELAEGTAQLAKTLLPPNHAHCALSLRVLAKVAHVQKQPELAAKLLKQSADCYKLVGCYREFEVTMQELSDHYALHKDNQMAYKIISDMMGFNLQAREARGIIL